MYQKIQATDIALRFLALASKEHLNRRLAEGYRLLNLAIVTRNDKLIKELHRLDVDAHERDHTPAFRSPLELFCIHGARDTDVLRDFISSCKDLSELDFEGRSLLHLACAYGHTNVAQELLDAGMNVNIESSDRITPIAEAVPGGYTAIVELLFDHDALVNVRDTGNRGWKACLLNRVPNITICRLLDDRGVNDWTEKTSCSFVTTFLPTFSRSVSSKQFDSWVSNTIHQLTPLHHLAFGSRLEVFKYVAEHVKNIDFNMQAELGITPLFFAVLVQNSPLVKFLLAHGAKTDIMYAPKRWSMLHIAAYLGNSMLVEELLSHGADACATDISGLRPSILALQNQKLHVTKILEDAEKSQLKSRAQITIESEKTSISPAMTDAIIRGDLLLCQSLVERGISIDGICECGCTPLICACANQHFKLAVYLLSIGASMDGITCKNKRVTRGFSPIHYAACFGNEDCLRILLEKGALASENPHSVQPIHLAAYNGHSKIIQMLLDHANDPKKLLDSPAFANPDQIADRINLEDRMVLAIKGRSEWISGKTLKSGRPLHFAAYMNEIEVIRVLLAAGADLETRDAKGMTAIQRTTKHNFNTDAFEVLVAAGVNLNTRDNQGQTPFLRAAKAGTKLILTKMKTYDQVDILARDREGENALNYAFRTSNKEGAQLLVESGLDVNGVDDVGVSAVQHSLIFGDSSFAIDHLPMTDIARSWYYGSALTTAVFSGHLDVVDLLLERAPSTDLQQYLDLKAGIGTALYCSVIGGNLDIMTKLLDKGADIDLVGGRHGSALIAACSMGHVELARELLRRGAALECVLPDGVSIKAEAAAKHHDQVQLLLERFTTNGLDGLDEPIPRKKADTVRVDEVIAELKMRQLETLPPVTTSLHSSGERNSSTGSVVVIEHDDKHPIIEIGEDGGE